MTLEELKEQGVTDRDIKYMLQIYNEQNKATGKTTFVVVHPILGDIVLTKQKDPLIVVNLYNPEERPLFYPIGSTFEPTDLSLGIMSSKFEE